MLIVQRVMTLLQFSPIPVFAAFGDHELVQVTRQQITEYFVH